MLLFIGLLSSVTLGERSRSAVNVPPLAPPGNHAHHRIITWLMTQYSHAYRSPSHDTTRCPVGLASFGSSSHRRGLCNVFEDFTTQLCDGQLAGLYINLSRDAVDGTHFSCHRTAFTISIASHFLRNSECFLWVHELASIYRLLVVRSGAIDCWLHGATVVFLAANVSL